MHTHARADRFVLIAALLVSCVMTGCVESSFELASESRLPKFVTLPPGLTRADVSVTLNYYTMRGAKFILKTSKGKKLAEINGKVKNIGPLYLKNSPGAPGYEIVVANGITEIMEHRKMEPIFYVSDDPAVRKALLDKRSGVRIYH